MAELVPVASPPNGALAAFRVLEAGVPVNLDVDDLELTAPAGYVLRLEDDELTVTLAGAGDPGPVDVGVASGTLALALEATVLVELVTHRYGASSAGVEALVAGLTLGPSSTPSVGDVDRWLDELAARVAGRLGDLSKLTDAQRAAVDARAAGLLHLGAGAYAEDAAHPDRVSSQADDRYGAVLWARFLEGLGELEDDVDELLAAAGAGPATGARHAAASFPPPLARRDAAW